MERSRALTADKYGSGQDPYCYENSTVLRNLLNLRNDADLEDAERRLSSARAEAIEFQLPPYDFDYLKSLHRNLFRDLNSWAGETRTVDISKDNTRFCTISRIIPESRKFFAALAERHWLEGLNRQDLILELAPVYGDLNVIHPFQDGNGRAQRLLFEHIVVNAGFEISWAPITQEEWVYANIKAVICDYTALRQTFEKAIGGSIS